MLVEQDLGVGGWQREERWRGIGIGVDDAVGGLHLQPFACISGMCARARGDVVGAGGTVGREIGVPPQAFTHVDTHGLGGGQSGCEESFGEVVGR